MKISFGAILLMISAHVFAAPHSIVNRYVDDFMVHMRTETVLTDEQTRRLSDALYDAINEREDIVESYNGETSLGSMMSMKKELAENNELLNQEVRLVLDEKQYEVFQKVQKEHAEKLKNRLKHRKQEVDVAPQL